jgi:hypothetical protein
MLRAPYLACFFIIATLITVPFISAFSEEEEIALIEKAYSEAESKVFSVSSACIPILERARLSVQSFFKKIEEERYRFLQENNLEINTNAELSNRSSGFFGRNNRIGFSYYNTFDPAQRVLLFFDVTAPDTLTVKVWIQHEDRHFFRERFFGIFEEYFYQNDSFFFDAIQKEIIERRENAQVPFIYEMYTKRTIPIWQKAVDQGYVYFPEFPEDEKTPYMLRKEKEAETIASVYSQEKIFFSVSARFELTPYQQLYIALEETVCYFSELFKDCALLERKANRYGFMGVETFAQEKREYPIFFFEYESDTERPLSSVYVAFGEESNDQVWIKMQLLNSFDDRFTRDSFIAKLKESLDQSEEFFRLKSQNIRDKGLWSYGSTNQRG